MSTNIAKISRHWHLSRQQAIELQQRYSSQVIRTSGKSLKDLTTVAGIDTHYHNGLATAAVVNMRLSNFSTVAVATAERHVTFPYLPGLLAFREGPVILDALGKLTPSPDVLIFDGQGIAHPRRFGLACHVGMIMDIPSIGCAKTCLSGSYKEPDAAKGSYSHLRDGKDIIGAVVRTRTEVKPLFVSVGHRIDLEDCIKVVLKCCRRYRLPEPIRKAHALARAPVELIG